MFHRNNPKRVAIHEDPRTKRDNKHCRRRNIASSRAIKAKAASRFEINIFRKVETLPGKTEVSLPSRLIVSQTKMYRTLFIQNHSNDKSDFTPAKEHRVHSSFNLISLRNSWWFPRQQGLTDPHQNFKGQRFRPITLVNSARCTVTSCSKEIYLFIDAAWFETSLYFVRKDLYQPRKSGQRRKGKDAQGKTFFLQPNKLRRRRAKKCIAEVERLVRTVAWHRLSKSGISEIS